jgi:hypothetical protein
MVIILGNAAGAPLPAFVTSKGIAARAAGQAFRPHNVCGFFLAWLSRRHREARAARRLRSMARARPHASSLQNEMAAEPEM